MGPHGKPNNGSTASTFGEPVPIYYVIIATIIIGKLSWVRTHKIYYSTDY